MADEAVPTENVGESEAPLQALAIITDDLEQQSQYETASSANQGDDVERLPQEDGETPQGGPTEVPDGENAEEGDAAVEQEAGAEAAGEDGEETGESSEERSKEQGQTEGDASRGDGAETSSGSEEEGENSARREGGEEEDGTGKDAKKGAAGEESSEGSSSEDEEGGEGRGDGGEEGGEGGGGEGSAREQSLATAMSDDQKADTTEAPPPPVEEAAREERVEAATESSSVPKVTMFKRADGAEPKYDRQALIEQYRDALAARFVIAKRNMEFQNRLAKHISKSKGEEKKEFQKDIRTQEQRYMRFMVERDELLRQLEGERQINLDQVEEVKARCDRQRMYMDVERMALQDLKRQVALASSYSRSGKWLSPMEVEQYIMTENKKETDVAHMRMENIKLKYKILKLEQALKSKEELGKGLHLIDFEQLKVENQSLNEKIEERNEELRKLRRKIAYTVQVLTHLKEKMEYVKGENLIQHSNLQVVEGQVSQKRDILTHTKQSRDMLRLDNNRLHEKSGLLCHKTLLRDFEERQEETVELSNKLEQLQIQYTKASLAIKKLRKSIALVGNDKA